MSASKNLYDALAMPGGAEIAAAYKGRIEQLMDRIKAEIEWLELHVDDENSLRATAVTPADDYMDELRSMSLRAMSDVCEIVEYPLADAAFLDDEARDLTEAESLWDQADDVFVVADGEKIRVFMPRLPHKRKPEQNKDRWISTGMEREIDVWVEAVRRGIRACGADLSRFRSATIYILFAVPVSPNIMDNDNRETVQLVSKICGELPCGNDPSAVRIILDAVVEDAFPESSVITILPSKTEATNNKTTLDFWKKYFASRAFVSKKDIEDRGKNNGSAATKRPTRRNATSAKSQQKRRH